MAGEHGPNQGVVIGPQHAGGDINNLVARELLRGQYIPAQPEHFVRRPEHTEKIHAQLESRSSDGRAALVAAWGEGGQGKTLLAHAYAREYEEHYPGGRFAVSVESNTLLTTLSGLCSTVSEAGRELRADELARIVRDCLSGGKLALLIVDNVRDQEHWRQIQAERFFLPEGKGDSDVPVLPGGACRVLVTTRAETLVGCEAIHVGRLAEPQAMEVLARYRADAADAENEEAVKAIIAEVEALAALVAAVGAKMKLSKNLSWGEYGERLKKAALADLPDVLPDGVGERVRAETGYGRTAVTALADLRAALPEPEQRVLDYASLLPQDNLVLHWLTALLTVDVAAEGDALHVDLGADEGGEARGVEDVIDHLVGIDLLRPLGSGKVTEDETGAAGRLWSVHNLHGKFAAAVLDQDEDRREALIDRVCELGKRRAAAAQNAVVEKSLRGEITPLVALSESLRQFGRIEEAASVANYLSTAFRGLGRFTEGRASLERFADDSPLCDLSEGGGRGSPVQPRLDPARPWRSGRSASADGAGH